MQKFNKAFAPSTAKPGLRRQEEAAGERRKERGACEGVQRQRWVGLVLAPRSRLSWTAVAPIPVVGVKRSPWPLDNMSSKI